MYYWEVYLGARNKPSHWVCTPCHKQHTSIGLLAYMLYPMCIYNPLPPSLPPYATTKDLPPTIINHPPPSLSFSPLPSLPTYNGRSLRTMSCIRCIRVLYSYCTYPPTPHHRGEFYKHTHPSRRRRQCSMCVCPSHAHTRPTVLTAQECNTLWRLNTRVCIQYLHLPLPKFNPNTNSLITTS